MLTSARVLRELADREQDPDQQRAMWAGAAALLELHWRRLKSGRYRSGVAAEVVGLWKLAGKVQLERRFADEVRADLVASGVLPGERR